MTHMGPYGPIWSIWIVIKKDSCILIFMKIQRLMITIFIKIQRLMNTIFMNIQRHLIRYTY